MWSGEDLFVLQTFKESKPQRIERYDLLVSPGACADWCVQVTK